MGLLLKLGDTGISVPQAPSSSLCLSLLELHSDSGQCARVLLSLADTISQQLQPTKSLGNRNPEVDYGFIIR